MPVACCQLLGPGKRGKGWVFGSPVFGLFRHLTQSWLLDDGKETGKGVPDLPHFVHLMAQ